MSGIKGVVKSVGTVNGCLQYTREELTMGLNTERMAQIVNSLGGDAKSLPDNLYSTYLNEIIRLLNEGGVGGGMTEEEKTAIMGEIEKLKTSMGIVPNDVVGLQVDYFNKVCHRLGQDIDFNSLSMYGGRKRCNVADDGTITAYYGDVNYAEDGSNGQVMVYQPKFYYMVVPLVLEKAKKGHHLRKANYYVSPTKHSGFKLHPAFINENGQEVDHILLSAFEGSIFDTSANAYLLLDEQVADFNNDKFCSIAGAKPASGVSQNLTRPNVEALCKNRGAGWHSMDIKQASMEQLLMIVELGTMNVQTAIGQGIVSLPWSTGSDGTSSYAGVTGSTSALGNGTGRATQTTTYEGGVPTPYTVDGKTSITYRGVENFWGNLWKFIYGVNIWGNGQMQGGEPFVCSDFNYAESKNSGNYVGAGFYVTEKEGYISAMGYSEEFDYLFFASECLGNSSLPVGDYHWVTQNLNGYRIALLGGYWNDGGNAGGFYWYLTNGVGNRRRGIGGRSVYVPVRV